MTPTPVDPAVLSGPVELVAECEALRAEVERLRKNVKGLAEVLGKLTEAHKRKCYATLDAETERDEARAQLAAAEARLEAVRQQAEEWRHYQPGAFYPEASAHANAIEGCGDALIDLLDVPLAALASAPEPEADDDPVACLPRHLAYISRTVTASYPVGMDDELVMRRRVGKVWVEVGELSDAIEGYTGENPRKGHYATGDDVIKELIDCASASLCAVEFMTGDKGYALGMLAEQVKGNAQRLSESIPDRCCDAPAPVDQPVPPTEPGEQATCGHGEEQR